MLIWARRAHNKTVVASQGATTSSRFRNQKWWLELSEGDENWNERWLGHGQRLEGIGLGIMCVQRAQSHAKRAQRALRAPLPCFLLYTAVKIGMYIQLDMANGWRVLVSGSCARSAHNRARSVLSKLCEHRYHVSCFIQL